LYQDEWQQLELLDTELRQFRLHCEAQLKLV